MEGTGRAFSFVILPATPSTIWGSFAITHASGTVMVSGAVVTVVADGIGTVCGLTNQVSTAFKSSNQ
jgi:hypothetical protein